MGDRILAKRAWDLLETYKTLTYLNTQGVPVRFTLEKSIPILYFGNINQYFESDFRIVTAALNPSLSEFPTTKPYMRFPRAEGLTSDSNNFFEGYFDALNEYFETGDHYKEWFGNQSGGVGFEAILNGMKASFFEGGKYGYRALHTDIGSPIATNPKWSDLKEHVLMKDGSVITDRLLQGGVPLWWDLMNNLAPDAIILSIGLEYFGLLGLPLIEDWDGPLYTVNYESRGKMKVYSVKTLPWVLSGKHKTLLVSGVECHSSPFRYINKADKHGIGLAIGQKIGIKWSP